jgi:hypothetical protein
MHTKTTLLAIFVIVTAIALVTAGSITASTLAVKKKSTTTTKKSTGSKTKSPKTSTGGSATTKAAGTGNSTLGGTDKISKFSMCMRLVSGPLTRANVDQCYNIVYGTSSTSSVIGSLPNAGPTSHAVPKTSKIGPSSSSSSTTLGTP